MAGKPTGKLSKLVKMLWQQGPTRTWDEFLCYWLSREIRQLEKQYGLELAEMNELQELTVQGENKQHGYPYGPSPPRVMRVVLDQFGTEFSQTIFVDLGSGKGLPMLMASHFNFQKIIGVEFALELHQAALKNIDRYHPPEQRSTDLEPLHLDVLDYDFPSSDLIVYLCNPFNERILRRIVQKLIQTREQSGRRISVIYHQMKREDGSTRAARMVRQTLEETGRLVSRPFRIRSLWDRIALSHLEFMIYDLR